MLLELLPRRPLILLFSTDVLIFAICCCDHWPRRENVANGSHSQLLSPAEIPGNIHADGGCRGN